MTSNDGRPRRLALFLAMMMLSVSARAQEGPDGGGAWYQVSGAYTGEVWANLAGGLDTGLRYMDNVDLTLALDLERAAGLPDSRLFVYGIANHGGRLSELTGDVQGISNIEAPSHWRLYEAWYELAIPAWSSSVKLGKYDINSEFDVTKTGLLFINSSHGIGAAYGSSGSAGPSIFPYPALGIRLQYHASPRWTLRAAVTDGIPSVRGPDPGPGGDRLFDAGDGLLAVAEISRISGDDNRLPDAASLGPGIRLVLGGWLYSEPRTGWDGRRQHEFGGYATAEGILADRRARGTGRQGPLVEGFVRVGLAHGAVNPFAVYAGAGLVATGAVSNRKEDQLGIAVAMPWISGAYEGYLARQGYRPADHETNIELTYRAVIAPWVQLQADVQYTINPGTRLDVSNAWTPGLRMTLSF